jgi:hypothetical protein
MPESLHDGTYSPDEATAEIGVDEIVRMAVLATGGQRSESHLPATPTRASPAPATPGREAKCNWCRYVGHVQRECQSKARGEPRVTPNAGKKRK